MIWNLKFSFFIIAVFSIQTGGNSQAKYNINEYSLLFIGNSLTYANNLPNLVMYDAKKRKLNLKTEMVAFPNYAISDHWNDGKVQSLIKSNHYDFVIIQQGPSSQNDGKEMLLQYGKKYKELCQKHNTRLVYFMVWPSLTYYNTFDGVIQNYTLAAKTNNAILCPVGKLWKENFEETQNFDYYGEDGFHPSKKGSEKAAEIIVDYLFNDI